MEQNYSVLMSVYKKEKPEYLKQAIESMINQTVQTNDFVLVCDGPLTPQMDSLIEAVCDQYPELFQIIRLEKNSGLGNALNVGLKKCRHELIARMDSDDISLANRCELQLKRFEEDPELAFCSGDIAEFITDEKEVRNVRHVPTGHQEIRRFAKKRNPMNHVAVMFRRSAVEAAGGYIEIPYFEDYYLWVRMLKKGYKAGNIHQILVNVRIGNGMYRRRGGISYAKNVCTLQKRMLEMHFISYFEFTRNCLVRIGGSIIPVGIRKYMYEKILRGVKCDKSSSSWMQC